MIKVSNDTLHCKGEMTLGEGRNSRIESEVEVKTYLDRLKYALNQGSKIEFQVERFVDTQRDEKYTNRYTMTTLFPNENPVDVLRRELLS